MNSLNSFIIVTKLDFYEKQSSPLRRVDLQLAKLDFPVNLEQDILVLNDKDDLKHGEELQTAAKPP